MPATIDIQRLWNQKYRDESVPFPVDGVASGLGSVAGGFSVQDPSFGAVGNGIHDDTTNIQAAINACVAAGGGIVFFPVGSYKISAGLTCPPTSLVAFLGAGPSGYSTLLGPGVSRILVPVGVTGLTYGTAGTGTYIGAPVMRDLHFQGPGATANSSTIGLNILNVSGFRIEDSTFSDFYTAGTGVAVTVSGGHESSYGHFTGCRFLKNHVGLDCGGNVTASLCLFDAEDNSLPTPAAGSVAIRNPASVSDCELQSYETLIDVTATDPGVRFLSNRYENFLNAVYFRPAIDTAYRGQVVGGSMFSAVGGAQGVRFNTHAGQVSVDIRSWVPHEDLNESNSILDPNYGIKHKVTGFDRGLGVGWSNASAVEWYTYPGTPEGLIAANPGSICSDHAHGTLYVKNSGTGNTGWILVTLASGGGVGGPVVPTLNSTYLGLPGGVGSGYTTPDTVSLRLTNGCDLRALCNLTSTANGSVQPLIHKFDSPQRMYFFGFDGSGRLRFDYSLTGVDDTNVTSTVVAPGGLLWYRVALDATVSSLAFYTSPDGTTWTQLGATITGAPAPLFAGTSAVTVADFEGFSFTVGKLYVAEVRDTVGTLVARFDATNLVQGATYTDVNSHVWSPQAGTTVLTDRTMDVQRLVSEGTYGPEGYVLKIVSGVPTWAAP